MILQALVRCYEALAGRGELEKEGWSPVKVSWGLELDADGQVKSLLLMGGTDAKGKQIPRIMKLPDPVKRASGIATNFLCDTIFLPNRPIKSGTWYNVMGDERWQNHTRYPKVSCWK